MSWGYLTGYGSELLSINTLIYSTAKKKRQQDNDAPVSAAKPLSILSKFNALSSDSADDLRDAKLGSKHDGIVELDEMSLDVGANKPKKKIKLRKAKQRTSLTEADMDRLDRFSQIANALPTHENYL